MRSDSFENTYALAPMQQGMLFHHLAARAGVDVEQIVGTLREPVDEASLEWAWRRVMERQDALRTVFHWKDVETPEQSVLDDVDLDWEAHDWRSDPPEQQEERFQAFLKADRERGFDFSQAPLFRVTLFRLGDADYRLVWTLSHVLMDGRSFSVVLREVFGYYETRLAGSELGLKPAPRYRDFIGWLETQNLDRSKEFWSNELAGFRTPTPLPVSTTGQEGRGHKYLTLSSGATERIRAMASRSGVTLNTMVQGAWGLVLSRYSGEEDVLFGATRAGRHSAPVDVENAVGLFINTLPVRLNTRGDQGLVAWLKQLRESQVRIREFEHTPLASILEWSELEGGKAPFDSIIVFDRETLSSTLRKTSPAWTNREFELLEQTTFPLTLYGYGEPTLSFKLAYDRDAFHDETAEHMLGHLGTLLEQMAEHPEHTLSGFSMLTAAERDQQLVAWNDTQRYYRKDHCIHQAFEAQVERTPEAGAVVFRDQQLTYAALNERANRMARRLRAMGVGPETLVGIHVHRSIDMMVGLLGILKAGGAYVPLDPEYPRDRIALMVEDSGIKVLLTETSLVPDLPPHHAEVLCVDQPLDAGLPPAPGNFNSGVRPHHLAYVIYTSGSTGKPKGVMVGHRNVMNFFAGMDERIGADPGVWLSVTSLSFDISVLELFWTLSRGFKVVIQAGEDEPGEGAVERIRHADRGVEFSLFYFAADEAEDVNDKYRLLMDGVRYADENGFSAVWTPERHFHAFGGLYPNPSVTSAAIAAVTKNVKIRAGSVVLPLHHPVRVAEEWSVVDNISNGRVGISFASGWQPRDFLLRPENYSDAKGVMMRELETVRKLWRGEEVTFTDPKGTDVPVKILPRPIQPELPFWLTAAGNPKTFEAAGRAGAGLLTHLLGQTIDSLADKLRIYRQAWKEAGHPGEGHVTLMLHSFVGTNPDAIRELVREPLKQYLRTSVNLLKGYASSWPLFKAQQNGDGNEIDLNALPPEEMDALLDHSFERYYETSGLFGTPESCLLMVDKAKGIGVDEIACLIDFGVESKAVLDSLQHLNALRIASNTPPSPEEEDPATADYSIPAQIWRHKVTHLQCTPSMAILLSQHEDTRAALAGLKRMMVGGEALPVKLAADLENLIQDGKVINMYGPTETTVWSTTYDLVGVNGSVPIGRPIANTQIYILDKNMQPVPVGVQGDLFIGGDSVVRGYLNRPELTRERFLPNPFPHSRGGYIYRTGDVARYRSDGVVEFLGRADFQVKIRGHRIELGEIETVLGENPAVREAVVTAGVDAGGHQRLLGYIRLKDGQTATVNDLRETLASRLPEYMVPSAFVFVDEFPLTPNGKVDRKRLPTPEAERPQLAEQYAAPRNGIEEILVQIWQESLGVERIGIHDDFFALGGHSLSTVQITFRIRREFNVDFPLQTLLRFPTIAGLAKEIEGRMLEQADTEKLEAMFSEIENLSEEEVQSLLRESS